MRRRTIALAVFALGLAALPPLLAPAVHAAGTSPSYLLRERLCLLQGYIERYANVHFNYYPPEGGVRKGGVLQAPFWPLDPWTGRPMTSGARPGQYTYRRTADRLSYRLTGHTPSGTIVLRGTVPYSRKLQNDHRGREGLELIQQYIEQWARTHDDLYPDVGQVDAAADVGQQPGIVYWPHDPWVHKGMKQATSWGNFTYTVSPAHDSYSIAIHYSRGGTFTLNGTAATSPWRRFRLALTDEILKRDLAVIDGYIRLYMAGHGAPPTPDELTPAGAVGLEHSDWPADPVSGAPFAPGEGVGHFTYTVGADGSYRLSAPLASSTEPFIIEGAITAGALRPPGR